MKQLLILLPVLSILSCTKNDGIEIKSELEVQEIATSILNFGEIGFDNKSEKILQRSIIKLQERTLQLTQRKNADQTMTFLEFAQLFEETMDIPTDETIAFLEMVKTNRDFILQEGSRELIEEEIYKIAAESAGPKSKNGGKALFRFLAKIIGGEDRHCSVDVVAGLLDTVASAAVTLITSPTGVGAVAGATVTAASYGTMIYDATQCIGQ